MTRFPVSATSFRRMLLACFCAFALSGYAQVTGLTDTTSTPIPGAGHDYVHMLSETVNPANGSVSVRIDLPVAKGRGLTLPFSIAYDSNGVEHLEGADYPHFGQTVWKSNQGYLGQGGWSYSAPMATITQNDVSAGNYPNNYTCMGFSDYMFFDASGGRHPLYMGSQYSGSGQCPLSSFSRNSGGDGPFGSYTPNTQPDPYYNPGAVAPWPLTVYDMDGTVYKFPSGQGPHTSNTGAFPPTYLPTSIEDRNGNVISVVDDNNGSFSYTDTIGRSALSVSGFGPSGATNTITVAGLTYHVTWKTVPMGSFSIPTPKWVGNSEGPTSQYDTCTQPVGGTGGSQTVVSQIALPNGQSYTFYYGSDNPNSAYNNPYGLLSEIDYPNGAWVRYKWALTSNFNEFSDFPGWMNAGAQTCSSDPYAVCPAAVKDGCLYEYNTPVLQSREVGFGGSSQAELTQIFTYNTTWDSSGTTWNSKTTEVAATDDVTSKTAETDYSYSPFASPVNDLFAFITYPGQVPLESSIVYHDFDGSVLETVTKSWLNMYDLACETHTLGSGGPTSGTWYQYNGVELKDKAEYDYGAVSASGCSAGQPGTTPTRETKIAYQPFSESPSGGYIFDRPSSVQILDNGTLEAETDYTYDGQSALASASAANHDDANFGTSVVGPRGNATMVKKRCLQSCADSPTSYTYDKAGQVVTSTDPDLNLTQYFYSDPNNTDAYLTQVIHPSTNGVNHSESYSYSYIDGQLQSSTDQNGHTTNYHYNSSPSWCGSPDGLDRLSEIDYPNGGSTGYCYADTAPSPSVTTETKITSGVTLISKATTDGVGHVTRTEIDSDPEGADYTDTVYDGMGRVWKKYNPYRSTGDSTYGFAQYDYDGLGRVTQITDADGSKATTSYSGNCTTTTDEAGHQRESCSDALGRLIMVEEPGATGTPASPGSGTATVNGTEQSTQVLQSAAVTATGNVQINGAAQWKAISSATTGGLTNITVEGTEQQYPAGIIAGSGTVTIGGNEQAPKITHAATPGVGSVTIGGSTDRSVQTQAAAPGTGTIWIGGSENSVTINECPNSYPYNCWITQWNQGGVFAYVNGFEGSSGYGQGSTPSTIAAQIASSLNTSSSPVTASVNGSTISVTAKGTGSASNYSLSGGSVVGNTAFFSSPAFGASVSGSTLTGGHDPVYQSDTGTATVAVNGYSKSESYNSGTTNVQLASALASDFNNDPSSPVGANASGGTISFTARQTGNGTNYSLSCSSATNNSNFTGTSFPCSPSGSSLTGGTDNQYVYDSGTVSITVNGHTSPASSWGQSSNAAGIAADLASKINGDSAASVTASVSSTVITLTAKTKGSISNYSLSSSVSYDSGDFSQSSFSASPSGGALTGGWPDASAIDHGTMTVTVNGQNHIVNWGQNDTSSSIAQNLVTAFSGDPSVKAWQSGTAVYVSPLTMGTAYSFSTSYTYDNANFTQSSFSTANSISDYGNATITVAGHSDSIPWAGGDTANSIASALTSAINGDGSAVVNASVSGSTVSLTARQTGAAANSDTISSSPGYDSAHFSAGQSFTSSNSGADLAGGKDAVYNTVYDAGTLSLTVNGFQASISYGQSSSSGSLANALLAQLNDPNSMSPVTASLNGSTLTMTAKEPGAATNYSLNWSSSSSQSSLFSSPSFSVNLPNSALTGGSDPVMNLSAPAVTQYSYNALDDLTCAVQKGQDTTPFTTCASASTTWRPRSFSYDSLSRLLSAANPESGTISYSYDLNGNVVSKTDARGITTKYSYDALNRLTQKIYQNDPSKTSQVTYGYDGVAGAVNCPSALTPANPVGRPTSMCDGAGTESWSYVLNVGTGWETVDQRTTNSITKTITSQDNLDGSLASVTYPDGRTVSFAPGGAGRPLTATDNSSGTNYVSGATYAPFGGLATLQMGPSISLSDSYNDRLQPVFLSAQGGAGTIYSLGYDFHANNGDNGNVYQIVNNKDANRTQNFTYDALNRIQTAYTSGPNWGEAFTIDLWGNLTNRDAVAGKTMYEPLNVGPALVSNQLPGFGYDPSGNMTQNGGAQYTYDAESRLTSAGGVNYLYDGDGNRVEKSSGTLYWGSGPLAESDLNGDTWTDYVFFNGKRVARIDPNGSLHYYLSDHLGSTSVVTDASGNIQSESDYYPYGGEMPITSGDTNHYKFTGKERDSESGLDNFGARYDSSALGRFMTPDWAERPTTVPYAVFGDPQSLNLYGYVRNDPVSNVDADGHQCAVYDASEEGCASGESTTSEDQTKNKAATKAQKQQRDSTIRISKSSYKTATAAAVAALDAIIGQSEKSGWEYGGRIVRLKNGKYAYVLPTTDKDDTAVDVDAGMKEGTRIPPGTTNAGDYHTHPTSCKYCAHDQFSGYDNAGAVREHLPSYIESGETRSIYLLDGTKRTSILDPTPPTVIRYGPPE